MTDPADAAPAPTRTSTRVRNKSSRALESETTDRLLAAAKDKAKNSTTAAATAEDVAGVQQEAGEEDEAAEGSKPGRRSTRASAPKAAVEKKKRAYKYCLCKERKPGPMIQCGECEDWFHFECIGLSEDDAEKIHQYSCKACEDKTGKTTTFKPDPESVPNSEAKEPEPVKKPARRPPKKASKRTAAKVKAKPKADDADDADVPSPAAEDSSSSEDDGSDAEPSEAESDGSYDSATAKRPAKRARAASPPKSPAKPRRASTSVQRRPSVPERKASTSESKPASKPEALPAARLYVADKMGATIRAIFGEDQMDAAAAEEYGKQVELALFAHLKENIKGKETAGGRYKAQFNLIHGSLGKEVRPDLKESIVDGTLTPAKVALLTSLELATAEQLEEIQRAEKEALRQAVKFEEEVVSMRAGRDGIEVIESNREDELAKLARREEEQRRRESGQLEPEDLDMGRRESEDSTRRESVDVPGSPTAIVHPSASPKSPIAEASPIVRRFKPQPVVRKPSMDLNSAWGTKDSDAMDVDYSGEQDQDAIDLSDIMGGNEEEDIGYAEEAEQEAAEDKAAIAAFVAKPVLWSGGITNPAAEGAVTPRMELRLVSGRTTPPGAYWKHLLPQDPVAITGRVPTATSLQYLADRRLDRTKELTTVAFSLTPDASTEEKLAWDELIEFHVSRDRHAIYHPYGNRPPPDAARELYLVPLRASDAVPDLFDMVDNFTLPRFGRKEAVLIGVFVANRDTPSNSAARSPADSHARIPPTGPRNQPSPPAPPAPSPNPHLAALLAGLDPAAIAAAAAAGGGSPVVPGLSPVTQQGRSPIAPPPGRSPLPPPQQPRPPPGGAPMPPGGMPPFPPRPPFPPTGFPAPPPGYGPPPPGGGYPGGQGQRLPPPGPAYRSPREGYSPNASRGGGGWGRPPPRGPRDDGYRRR